MSDIQNMVISLLNDSGKTDSEIEKDLNLPRSTIYDWRNGRSKSYKKYISEVAEYFNVSTDYLLGNEQKNKPSPEEDGLSDKEKLLLERFRMLSGAEQDMMLRAARSESDRMNKEDM